MKKTFVIVLFVLAIVGVTSCNLKNDNTTPPASAFGLVNASPNAGNIDVLLNGNPVVRNLPYGVDTGYYTIQSGSYTLTVDSAGSATQWYNAGINFEPAMSYSVFIIDSVSKMRTSVVADSVTAPSADSVQFRFLNFSPNTPPIDVALSGTVVSSNRAYNDVTSNTNAAKFAFLAPGTYNVELRIANTSTVLLSVPNVALQGGKIYTLYAKGFVGDTGVGALSLGTLVHNQ